MTSTPTGPPSGVRIGVVVVAAGSGTRLGAGRPKAFVPLAGAPLLAYAVDTVARLAHLGAVAIVVPPSHEDRAHPDWAGVSLPEQAVVVVGGSERTDSVLAGLTALPDCDIVLVHDAARALTPLSVFESVVEAVSGGSDGVIPGLAVVDTIKVVDESGVIVDTPDRARLRAVQTPQGFRSEVLHAAYALGVSATDDAALVERAGFQVRVVDGHPDAFKVTTPEDLARAERLIARGWSP